MKTVQYIAFIATIMPLMGCSNSSSQSSSNETAPVSHTEIADLPSEINDTLIYKSQEVIDGFDFVLLTMNPENAVVSLADSVIPSIDDTSIALCVEAAFTGEKLKEFKSSNVAGDYIIDGLLHKGYKCKANTGFLCTVNGQPFISDLSNLSDYLETKETLFQQILLVQNGKDVYKNSPIKPNARNIYRAACITSNGNFAIIQSLSKASLKFFISSLIKLGVSDALYLDMGTGWNYGWYRQTSDSPAIKFFEVRTPYQTNWLVIKSRTVK